MSVASVFAAAAAEPTVVQPPPKKMSEMDRMLEEIKQKDVERQQKKEQFLATQQPKKRRAIDDFLEEIKERGPTGTYVDEDGHSLSKGSFDSGDPETTNLYVGNLAPTVTEEVLEVLCVDAVLPHVPVGTSLISRRWRCSESSASSGRFTRSRLCGHGPRRSALVGATAAL